MILLSGFPKTGNTWLKFVLCNYYFIKEKNARKTLTYEQLDDIFKHPISLHHTHIPYSGKLISGEVKNIEKFYKKFDKLIYIWRNPHDTMISFWHYLKNRDPPFNLLQKNFTPEQIESFNELEGFTRYFLPIYIDHVESTRKRADLVLNYDDLVKNPFLFKEAVKMVYKHLNNKAFLRAIRISSFNNIRKMGIEKNQKHGLAKDYLGHFCRNGKSGQYLEVMNKDLIEYITTEWEKHFSP